MKVLVGYRGRAGRGWIDAMLRAVPGGGEVSRVEGGGFGVAGRGASVSWADGEVVARLGALGADGWVDVRVAGSDTHVAVDPIGAMTVFVARVEDAWVWSTSLDAVIAAPGVRRDIDVSAVRSLMITSLVADGRTLVAGVSRLAPGASATLSDAGLDEASPAAPSWTLRDPGSVAAAAAAIDAAGRDAVARRLPPGAPVGLFLSGGLDSAAVAVWLRGLGVPALAFTLDLGPDDVEADAAEAIGRRVGIPVRRVPLDGRRVRALLPALVRALDVPSFDAAAVGHAALAQAARGAGLRVVFNGEGGDQLFGGWSTRPVVTAAALGEDEVGATLRTFHRFHGAESWLFGPGVAAAPFDERALIARFLAGGDDLVTRTRRLDLLLRGRWALAPRAARVGAAFGLDVRMPLLDPALTDLAMSLPPTLKLTGAAQKAVLREVLRPWLPAGLVDRPKSGMSLPVTRWVDTSLLGVVHDLLSPAAARPRGLLRPEGVAAVLRDEIAPAEARRRRRGEKVWALLMLEAWLRARGVPGVG